MNAKATDYTTILPTGKENAKSTNELAVIMGFSDSRSLQAGYSKEPERRTDYFIKYARRLLSI